MSQSQWTAVDDYFSDLFIPADPVMDEVLRFSAEQDLPPINVSSAQGKLLMMLAKLQRAQTILEIGTLGGYSTIWLARALPADGRIITLEFSPHHAQVAQANLERAGVADKVTIITGRAVDSLNQLIQAGTAPFDMVFIDADKVNTPNYLMLSLQLSRVGTLIIADNIVREGQVLATDSDDENILGIRHFNELVSNDPRLEATALPRKSP